MTTPYRITFDDFAIAFVPFALLLGAALLAPEATIDLGFYRTVYTIWATAALVTPALCAFILPGTSPRQQALWLLFWTASFLVYVVHMLYAYFSVYHGSFQEFMAGQGVFPAINNVVFTLWWILDLALAWFSTKDARWVHGQRVVLHWYAALLFFTSTVILKHGFVNVIGALYTAAILVCLMIRFDRRRAAAAPAA